MHAGFDIAPRTGKILFLSMLLLLLLLVALPLNFPRTVATRGSIMPEKEWILWRGDQGNLMATLYNHRTGMVEEYTASDIQRGDVFRFLMNPALLGKDRISTGDTIGTIESSMLSRELIRLEGELNVARSSLFMEASGDKASIIKEFDERYRMAGENLNLQRHMTARQDSLFERNLISNEEAQIAKSNMRIAEIQARIAEYQLHTVLEGVKPERIDLLESQIGALDREIRTMKEQFAVLNFVSPITGTLHRYFESDTLLSIGSDSSVVITMIPWDERSELSMDRPVRIHLPGRETVQGRLMRVADRIEYAGQVPGFMAVASLEEAAGSIPAHMIVQCHFPCRPFLLRQKAWAFLKMVFGSN